jgi:hypothetical protein
LDVWNSGLGKELNLTKREALDLGSLVEEEVY